VESRGFIIAFFAAVAVVAMAGATYVFLTMNRSADTPVTAAPDPAQFEGEDVEDALAVENPPLETAPGEGDETGDALGGEGGVDGDPWLDPEAVEGEEIQGSGDFVEGEEPFEDVYAAPPDGGAGAGQAPAEDPIDPSELPQEEAPAETPPAAEPPAPQ
jgi:hypothetical protein